jgi:hypothetical protein
LVAYNTNAKTILMKAHVVTRAYLTPPTIGEEKQLYTIPNDVEGKPSGDEELPVKPAFTHN